MDDDVRQRLASSFGPVAEAYDRGRPSFPTEAASWLVGREAATVLELGAGTGKLTRQLVALGHDVHASEPDAEMLGVLRRRLPDIPTSESGAEEIPLPDRSVDVVVAAQAFHWFDHERALPEIARVLRPGGALALAWNLRDERIPWVRKLGRLLANADLHHRVQDATAALVRSELFGFVDEHTFTFWQDVNRESIVDLAASRSYVATLDDDAREAKLAEVLDLYDDYGRGMDGMRLPYTCECFRAVVVERPGQEDDTADEGDDHPPTDPPTDPPAGPSGPSDGTDTDMLLIDFR
ncbi:class I SAM-dependent methyltransferase [Nocardioides coralli]|uniref:class I SAM-dependent methyltransferase n=1 Tax=Nocardioides coralli TaxID=2872154 RepID=UPI001CA39D00|nr:class I SAM-dependent methyltransferase [Nocardioides coralli]QZY29373.1 class I SAM-dependent methyltransferase [Nocardioides coralli]